VLSSPLSAADGIPENAANGDPCGGIRPCDLGGEFTINEMLAQRPYSIRGVCESRCFWQAVVTNSCFEPDCTRAALVRSVSGKPERVRFLSVSFYNARVSAL
jgi:hypothetical protein